ncbi:hypothetical protein NQT62_00600 [Limnobacter humi]|uniref:Uncharacterized protein n=1 Tax=Limnobacter humi TaxID=1778671 RepID=A0ABT1WDX5_9BURK|nr:hypothetical protein [Limnobacter humi]MCQ8894937.1 hypothetical protein [Limnobacter humi]
MQAIHLYATPVLNNPLLQAVKLETPTASLHTGPDLDDALAVVLQAVRESQQPGALEALGQMLAYMEQLEKTSTPDSVSDAWVMLKAPVTLTV